MILFQLPVVVVLGLAGPTAQQRAVVEFNKEEGNALIQRTPSYPARLTAKKLSCACLNHVQVSTCNLFV